METEAYTLYSGSSGNSVYIRSGDDAILVDCGKTSASLRRALCSVGGSMENVRAVFVTHEHRDHVSALPVIAGRYPIPIHITSASLCSLPETERCRVSQSAVAHPPIFSVTVGNMTVRSFETSHDSAASVGYTVDFGGDVRLGIITDTGCVNGEMAKALAGCTHVILESNHDVGMLMRGSYPFFLKERILSARGHLSNDAAASFAVTLAEAGARSFTLAHISRENNTPETALRAVSAALSDVGGHFDINVASPDVPVKVI